MTKWIVTVTETYIVEAKTRREAEQQLEGDQHTTDCKGRSIVANLKLKGMKV